MEILEIIFESFILAIMVYIAMWVIEHLASLLFKPIERNIVRNEYSKIIEELHGDYDKFDEIVIRHMRRAFGVEEDKK